MPDASRKIVDSIVGRGLISASVVASELRDRLANRLSRRKLSSYEILDLARDILSDFEPLLGRILADTDLAAWLFGVHDVSKIVPKNVLKMLEAQFPDPLIPGVIFIDPRDAEGPTITFPKIDKAVRDLRDRNIVTRKSYDVMTNAARQRAFTIARQASEETIGSIRDLLVEVVEEGPTLRRFRDLVHEKVGASQVGAAHLENVYRTNVQTAFTNGQEALLSHPAVSPVFPYMRYIAIRDGRVRDTHLALETLGLDGTNIYRRDDPMWSFFRPPWDYQ